MNSFYPRTSTLWLNSMDIYQESLRAGLAPSSAADSVIQNVATHICAALDEVLALPPILPRDLAPAVYDWLALMPGFDNLPAVRQEIAALHREKVAKGLL
jgi:hypothetical protein